MLPLRSFMKKPTFICASGDGDLGLWVEFATQGFGISVRKSFLQSRPALEVIISIPNGTYEFVNASYTFVGEY